MFQVNVQELCHPDCLPQADKSHQLEVNYSQSPEFPTAASKQETELSLDTSRETGEEEEGGSDSSGLQETSVLTHSEEEEEVLSSKNKSILPPSVLDQADVIAEHFMGRLSRQSSLVSDDRSSLVSPSPPVDNDVFQIPSTRTDLEKQTQTMAASLSEPQGSSENNLSANPGDGEPRSTLSKKDRLLIHKIRRYYEHAEHQDADFSIKRRESLSYIPAGLVRQLSRHLNNVPPDNLGPVHRKELSRNRPTSWSVFDLPGLEKNQTAAPQLQIKAGAADIRTGEEKFRPSSDMLKVWEVMETEEESKEVRQAAEEKLDDSRLEVTQTVSSDTADIKTSRQPPLLEESEVSTTSDVSSTNTSSSAVEGGSDQDSKPCRTHELEEDSHFSPNHLPRISNLRTSVDEGKVKNKVFQLARQYSQRIKNNRPLLRQRPRLPASQEDLRSVPAVPEEMRKKGKYASKDLFILQRSVISLI